eukprot:4781439-Alexandrium_andersonii.AAC.1
MRCHAVPRGATRCHAVPHGATRYHVVPPPQHCATRSSAAVKVGESDVLVVPTSTEWEHLGNSI